MTEIIAIVLIISVFFGFSYWLICVADDEVFSEFEELPVNPAPKLKGSARDRRKARRQQDRWA